MVWTGLWLGIFNERVCLVIFYLVTKFHTMMLQFAGNVLSEISLFTLTNFQFLQFCYGNDKIPVTHSSVLVENSSQITHNLSVVRTLCTIYGRTHAGKFLSKRLILANNDTYAVASL